MDVVTADVVPAFWVEVVFVKRDVVRGFWVVSDVVEVEVVPGFWVVVVIKDGSVIKAIKVKQMICFQYLNMTEVRIESYVDTRMTA